jgi:hypothetical protein
MLIHNAAITGSLTYNGIDISDITSSEASVASLNSFSSSILSYTASNNTNINALQTFSSSILTYTASNDSINTTQNNRLSSLETTSGSLINASSSFSTRVSSLESFSSSLDSTFATDAELTSLSSSVAGRLTTDENTITNNSSSFASRLTTDESNISSLQTASGSFSTRTTNLETASGSFSTRVTSNESNITSLNSKTGSYATTGSNIFVNTQYISAANNSFSFTSTASLYTDGGVRVSKDLYVSGTSYFNNVTIYGTQSVQYITSSQLNIGTNIINVNTDTPSIRFGGLSVYDSGSTGLTGSMLWDSQDNQWIYSNPSGSTYDSAMFLVGPRNSGALGNEVGINCNFLSKGNGMHHMTSSGIFEDGSVTCIPNTLSIASTSTFNGCVNINTGNQIRLYNSAKNNWVQIESPLVSGDSAIDFKLTTQSGVLYINNTGITCFNNTVCTPALVVNKSNPVLYINAGNNETATIGITQGAVSGYGGFIKVTTGLGDRAMTFGLSAAGTNNDATELIRLDDSGVTCFSSGICVGGDITGKGAFNGYAGTTHNLLIDWSAESQVTTLTNTNLFFGTNAERRATIFGSGIACFACQVCVPTLVTTNCVNIGTTVSLGSRLSIQSANDQAGITMFNTFDCNKWSLRTSTPNVSNKGFAIVDDICNATRIQIDGAGNVGIGAAAPTGQLHICGSDPAFRIQSTVSGNMQFGQWDGTNNRIQASGRNFLLQVQDANAMVFATDATERLRITSTGITCFACQVCTPASVIRGTINEQLILDFIAGAGSYTHQSFRLCGTNQYRLIGDTNGSFILRNDIVSSNVLTFACTGGATFACSVNAVGLFSTTSASGNLASKIRNGVASSSGTTGYGLAIESEASAASSYALTVRNLAETSTYFHILTETGRVGNVGINTTTPNYKLEVNGTSCFAGNVTIGGSYCAFALNVHGVTYQIGGSVWVQNGYGYVNSGAVSTGLFPQSDCTIQLRIANSTALIIDSTQKIGIGSTTPQTRAFVLGLAGGQVGAGGCGCSTYSGGGKPAIYNYFGDQFGNGAPYGTSAGAIAPYTVWYGGGAGGYFRGGDGDPSPGGGGAGIVAIGGDGSSYAASGAPYAEGGAGIYAKGGCNLLTGVRTWAGYFDGPLYACGNVGIGTTSPSAKLNIHDIASSDTTSGLVVCSSGWGSISNAMVRFEGGPSSDGNILLLKSVCNNRSDSEIFEVQNTGGNTAFVIKGNGRVGIGTSSPSYTLHTGGRGYFFATNQDAGWGMLTLDYGNGVNGSIYAIQMAEGGATNAAVGYGSYASSNCGDIVMWTNDGGGLVERSRMYSNGAAKIATMGANSTTVIQKSFSVAAGACVNVCFDISTDIPSRGTGYVFQADIHVGGYGSAGASGLLYKASVAGYDGHYVGIGAYHKDAELVKCASGVDIKIYNPSSNSNLLGVTVYNCSGTYTHVGTLRMVLTY